MALGGSNCPWCRYYNAADAGRCGRCEKWLPPPLISAALRQLREVDLLATKTLAGICIVVFVLEMASNGGGDLPIFTGMKASTLMRFGALAGPNTAGQELGWTEPWRLLASCFVHMGVLHIAFNLLALADLGRIIERENGGQRLVIAFVVTGILGFVASTVWYRFMGTPYFTAGASGAVFGIDGVLLGQMMLRRDPRWKSMLVRTLVYSFIFYFAMGTSTGAWTNQAAHMGGLAAGLLLGAAFQLESRPWKVVWFTVPLTAICLVASPLSVAVATFSPLWRQVRADEEQRDIDRDLMQDEATRQLRGETPSRQGSTPVDPAPTDGEADQPGAGASPEPPAQEQPTESPSPDAPDDQTDDGGSTEEAGSSAQ